MKTLLLKRTVTTFVLGLLFVLSGIGLYAQTYPVITSPNGGENWQVGSVHNILWQPGPPPVLAEVDIDYSTDNGTTWINLTQQILNTGTYSWTIPNTPSTQCLVKVYEYGNYTDMSDNVFTISAVMGIDETGKDDVCFVYPNPSNGTFTISIKGINNAVELSIINLQGQEVYKEKLNVTGNYTKQLALNGYPKGIYFLKLMDGEVVKTEKIIVY